MMEESQLVTDGEKSWAHECGRNSQPTFPQAAPTSPSIPRLVPNRTQAVRMSCGFMAAMSMLPPVHRSTPTPRECIGPSRTKRRNDTMTHQRKLGGALGRELQQDPLIASSHNHSAHTASLQFTLSPGGRAHHLLHFSSFLLPFPQPSSSSAKTGVNHSQHSPPRTSQGTHDGQNEQRQHVSDILLHAQNRPQAQPNSLRGPKDERLPRQEARAAGHDCPPRHPAEQPQRRAHVGPPRGPSTAGGEEGGGCEDGYCGGCYLQEDV